MMLPALITSPPYFLTPSILGFESRPLCVEPPPFLCAISRYSWYFAAEPASTDDSADLQFSEVLPVTLAFLIVLATTHFKNGHFVVPAVSHNCECNSCAGHQGRTNLDCAAFSDSQ